MVKTRDRKTSENCDNPEERLWRPELRWWPWKQRRRRENIQVVLKGTPD